LISDPFNLDSTSTSFGHLRFKFLPIVLIEMVATLFGSDSSLLFKKKKNNLLLHFSTMTVKLFFEIQISNFHS